jgi:hypothetical protein
MNAPTTLDSGDSWPDVTVSEPGTVSREDVPDDRDDNPEKTGDDPKEPKKSASTLLVEIAENQYEFGVSDGGETYAVPRDDHKVVLMLRGGRTSLRGQLSKLFFEQYGRAAPQQALADALLVVEGKAQASEPVPLYLRVAYAEDALWLDLGDHTGQAVKITSTEWSTVDCPSTLFFKRTALTARLPEPVRGGTLADLWRLLNVAEPDRPLVAAWLVAALFSNIPHPVLGLFGEQGTGKSTAGKILALALDPSEVPARKPPRDADSWVTAASGSWVVALDNLSDVPAWLSDSLCRAVTGDGDVRRKLYTDGDLAVFAFRRAVIVNSIDLGAMRGDLAERMLPVDLDLIEEDNRRDEQELWAAWREAHPRILGALLDLAAGVIRVLPSVRLASKPRMADFARILAAVDQLLSTNGLHRYRTRAVDLAADGLSADPLVVMMLAALPEPPTPFEGTSTQLLTAVTPTPLPGEKDWVPPRGWPADARAATVQLRRIAPALRKTGWTVDDLGADNHAKVKRWRIGRPDPENSRSDPREHPHPRNSAGDSGDAGMCGDGSGTSHGPAGDPRCRVCGDPLDPVNSPASPAGTHPTCCDPLP